jgi:ABC-type branched-subunit amino acid transport system substrate-binding protein
MARAISAAGTDRSAIRRYLSSISSANAYRGLTGAIRFGPGGDPVESPYRVMRIQSGSFMLAGGAR